jgi:hypothetical protein
MWGPWNIFPPATQQQKKYEEIPETVFWTKIVVILVVALSILLLTYIAINNS